MIKPICALINLSAGAESRPLDNFILVAING